jgi:hypothetical protein
MGLDVEPWIRHASRKAPFFDVGLMFLRKEEGGGGGS